MRRAFLISGILSVLLLAGAPGAVVWAKDIKLGGEPDKNKLPATMIPLKRISVAIRGEDGSWKHIAIDCWLAGTDEVNAKELDVNKNIIIAKADHELPNRNFEIMQSAVQGTAEAKKVIHAAVEASIGHEWKGQVLIKNMLVY